MKKTATTLFERFRPLYQEYGLTPSLIFQEEQSIPYFYYHGDIFYLNLAYMPNQLEEYMLPVIYDYLYPYLHIIMDDMEIRPMNKMEDSEQYYTLIHDEEYCILGGEEYFSDYESYLKKEDNIFSENGMFFGIFKAKELIGIFIASRDKARAVLAYEIGYGFKRNYQNQGYGTKCIRVMLEFFFEKLQIPLILADHFVFNERSKHLLEKFGFQREGTLHLCYNHWKLGAVDLVKYYIDKKNFQK